MGGVAERGNPPVGSTGAIPGIDTSSILRRVYSKDLGPHFDLWQKSNDHREKHGEGCGVYPSDPEDAPLWPLLTALVKGRRFLEIGCGLGYTACLMGEAGGPACSVDSIEAVPQHADLAEQEFSRRDLSGRIRVLRGQARDLLPRLVEAYDVIFLDADWGEFPQFLPHLTRLVRPGGILVSANLFPLFAEWAKEMPEKEAVEEYLRRLIAEPRFRTYIIPEKWHAISYRL